MSKLDIGYNITQLFKYCGDYINSRSSIKDSSGNIAVIPYNTKTWAYLDTFQISGSILVRVLKYFRPSLTNSAIRRLSSGSNLDLMCMLETFFVERLALFSLVSMYGLSSIEFQAHKLDFVDSYIDVASFYNNKSISSAYEATVKLLNLTSVGTSSITDKIALLESNSLR